MNGDFISRRFSRRGQILLSAVLLLLVGAGLWLALRPAPPSVTVDYINVGHIGDTEPGVVGDSILIQSSEGKVALIDGGYPDTGVLPYLKSQNITHIDLLVVTHAHDDHTGGLAEVLRAIPVDRLVHNGQGLDSPIYAEFQRAIQESGVPVSVVKAGDKLPFGRLTFLVLSPRKVNPNSINNSSVVLRLVVGKIGFLFTGDMQQLEENRLLAINAQVQADILKLAHHGAATSSSAPFIERVKPSVAIYSAGKDNKYGFPEKSTLDTLHALGVEVYGTDINGTIRVTTDGKTYVVHPERGGPLDQ